MQRLALFVRWFTVLAILGLCLAQAAIRPARAQSEIPGPYDLIAAVNAFRAGYGLPALEVHGTLMAIAQAHSDYQASIGSVTHFGPGGSRPRDRAYAAGYGGGKTVFISENIAGGGKMSVEDAIYKYWQDEAHLNTMINPQYQHVGAGVGVANGAVYFTLDVGVITGVEANNTPVPAGTAGTPQPTVVSQIMMPVKTSTPGEDGSLVHVVQAGQTLWSIAIAYDVKILEIAQLNNLSADQPLIRVGQELLIRPAAPPTASPTHAPTLAPTRTLKPTQTRTQEAPGRTPEALKEPPATRAPLFPNVSSLETPDRQLLGLVLIAVCGLGLVMMLAGSLRPR